MLRIDWIESLLVVGLWVPSLVLLTGCGGTVPGGKLLPNRAGDWRAVSEVATYDTETIFGYIDGHAEVYLAYGLERCLSRRYGGPDEEPEIVVDLFEMATSDDAFGVFTHDLDGEEAAIGHDGLYRYGWLSFWKGRWFVSIYAEDETDAAKAAVFSLGHAVAASLDADADRPALVGVLPKDGLDRRSVRFLRSEQILRTHLYLGDDPVFGLAPDTGAVLAKVVRDGWSAWVAVVDFPDDGRARESFDLFAGRFLAGSATSGAVQDPAGRWYAARLEGRRLVAVIGAGSEELAGSLLDEVEGGGE